MADRPTVFHHTFEQASSPEGFAEMVAHHLQQETNPDDGWVPATMLWAVADGEWLGRVSVRHELNDFLRQVGGHIGYAVRPSVRRRGIGGLLMRAGLDRLAELGVDNALVTCDDDNVASYRIIESAGGALENVVEGKRRY
ncbi:MAG: GNAT family N-acetyltransferase [Propionibacteriaceae bacterium]|nr:GNAT family N-acetyltransferase [Propionibacteriaceae bacterium]